MHGSESSGLVVGVCTDPAYVPVSRCVLSEYYEGITREEMDQFWLDEGYFLSRLWPDPDRYRDWAAAMSWFYTDWPYYDDIYRNRDMLGEVSVEPLRHVTEQIYM